MTDLRPLAQWTVPQDEIDHLGHMSTLFYAHRSDQGVARILEQIGGKPEALAEAGLMAAIVDRHTHFRREQLLGASLVLAGGVAGSSPQGLEIYQEMANATTGDVAAMFRTGVQIQHRATREAAVLPESWLEEASKRRIEPSARSQPRTLPLDQMGADLTPADFLGVGIASHLRREITAEDCDGDGFLAPLPPKLWAPTGRYNQGVMDQVWGAVRGFAWPALEMRSLNPRIPRVGDVLETYTALLRVGHKVIQSGTWVFEARSQALVSINRQVTIFFNLTARRPQDMPSDVRSRLTELATPGLLPAHAGAAA